jgi:ABC-type uncharacterized transport system auxiliary subunit
MLQTFPPTKLSLFCGLALVVCLGGCTVRPLPDIFFLLVQLTFAILELL